MILLAISSGKSPSVIITHISEFQRNMSNVNIKAKFFHSAHILAIHNAFESREIAEKYVFLKGIFLFK